MFIKSLILSVFLLFFRGGESHVKYSFDLDVDYITERLVGKTFSLFHLSGQCFCFCFLNFKDFLVKKWSLLSSNSVYIDSYFSFFICRKVYLSILLNNLRDFVFHKCHVKKFTFNVICELFRLHFSHLTSSHRRLYQHKMFCWNGGSESV